MSNNSYVFFRLELLSVTQQPAVRYNHRAECSSSSSMCGKTLGSCY